MATTRFKDHILTGTTAARPAATAVPVGTLYASSTDGVIYQSDGSTWGTWLAAPSSGGGGAWTLLSTTTLASPGTFDVSSISGSYNDLLLNLIGRSADTFTVDTPILRFNNDSGSNYGWQGLTVSGTAAPTATEGNSVARIELGVIPAANAAANWFGVFEIMVAGYASTTWYKTARSRSSLAKSLTTGDRNMREYLGAWANTAAINRVQLLLTGGANYVTGSQLRIYGRL